MSRNKKPAGGTNHQAGIATTQHPKHSPSMTRMKAHAVWLALPATLAGILFLAAVGQLLEVLR